MLCVFVLAAKPPGPLMARFHSEPPDNFLGGDWNFSWSLWYRWDPGKSFFALQETYKTHSVISAWQTPDRHLTDPWQTDPWQTDPWQTPDRHLTDTWQTDPWQTPDRELTDRHLTDRPLTDPWLTDPWQTPDRPLTDPWQIDPWQTPATIFTQFLWPNGTQENHGVLPFSQGWCRKRGTYSLCSQVPKLIGKCCHLLFSFFHRKK